MNAVVFRSRFIFDVIRNRRFYIIFTICFDCDASFNGRRWCDDVIGRRFVVTFVAVVVFVVVASVGCERRLQTSAAGVSSQLRVERCRVRRSDVRGRVMVRRRRGQRPSGGRDRRRQVVLPVDVRRRGQGRYCIRTVGAERLTCKSKCNIKSLKLTYLRFWFTVVAIEIHPLLITNSFKFMSYCSFLAKSNSNYVLLV